MAAWRLVIWSLLVVACVTSSFAFVGASTSKKNKDEKPFKAFKDDEDEQENRYATKVDTELIGDKTNFAGLSPIVLEGVGLVVGLNGTGGDPAPSMYRTAMLDDLKRRNVPNPNAILKSPNTALVLVRAYLPPLMKKGEALDLEVRLPDSANASSLSGGWLMETYLSEQMFVSSRTTPLKSHAYATASGAIMTAGIGTDANNTPELQMRGRVLGGATIMKERELAIYLRHDFRSIRNAARIAEVIGGRFHDFDEYGSKKPMAKAKTDQKVVLNVHPRYKDNYPRYLQVIRHMAFKETTVATRVRMQRLEKEIFFPEKSERTCLELEAIGKDAIPILKQGLTSPLLECRFHAASALAYLGNLEGLPALVEATRTERAFRVFALAAISTLEDADAQLALRELMNEQSPETRYGSFRALWTLNKRDPFIRGEELGRLKDLEQEERKRRKTGEYSLHVLETSGEPLVHALTRARPEIVLFGAAQEFRTPLYVSAGRHIIVTAESGSPTITLSRFQIGKRDETRVTSLKVADVIRAADELGATYPDVVQMLFDGSKQKNLPTRLAIDSLPESGRVYYRPDSATEPGRKVKSKVKVGRPNLTPNLFPEQEERDPETERRKAEAKANMANVPPEKMKPGEEKKRKITADDTPNGKSTSSQSRKGTDVKASETSKRSSKKTDSDIADPKNSEPDDSDKPKSRFPWFGWTRSDK